MLVFCTLDNPALPAQGMVFPTSVKAINISSIGMPAALLPGRLSRGQLASHHRHLETASLGRRMQEILGRKGSFGELTLLCSWWEAKNVHPKAVLSTKHSRLCQEGLYQGTPSKMTWTTKLVTIWQDNVWFISYYPYLSTVPSDKKKCRSPNCLKTESQRAHFWEAWALMERLSQG